MFVIERRRFFELAAAGVAAAFVVRTRHAFAADPVRVTRKEATVKRVDFDPRRPPRGMPTLTPPEAGVCHAEFGLDCGVGYSIEPVSPTAVKLFVDELDLITLLDLTLYTQVGSPPKLHAHEESHATIAQYYYKNAVRHAAAVGKAEIGKSYAGAGRDKKSAEQDGYQKIIQSLTDAYMSRTRLRALAANNRFDDITQHGLNPTPEKDAIAKAIASDPEA